MSEQGKNWQEMVSMECKECTSERQRRNRLLKEKDPRLHQEPFLTAPYVHKNNDPKYHAMLLRTVEAAKRADKTPKHIMLITAEDSFQNPNELARSEDKRQQPRERLLQFNDMKTNGNPGLLPVFLGMKVRVTSKIADGSDAQKRPIKILKHTSCTICGWEKHPADEEMQKGSQRILNYMPTIIFLKFENADWKVHRNLDKGVWPLWPVKRQWIVNKSTGTTAIRKGFTLVPDYASTAFMMQGETLKAAIAECGDIFAETNIDEVLTTYVILSCVKRACNLLLLHAFSPNLFRMGSPPGPACLIKHLKHRLTSSGDAGGIPYTKAHYNILIFAKTATFTNGQQKQTI